MHQQAPNVEGTAQPMDALIARCSYPEVEPLLSKKTDGVLTEDCSVLQDRKSSAIHYRHRATGRTWRHLKGRITEHNDLQLGGPGKCLLSYRLLHACKG